MITAPLIVLICFFAVLIGAGIYDIKTFTIPNIIPLVLIGLFLIAAGLVPLTLSQWGLQVFAGTIAFLFGFILFVLGLMGGGDVKLFGAVGLWVLPSNILVLTVFVTVTGTVLALAVLIVKIVKLRRVDTANKSWKQAYLASRKTRIPYGPAITVGTMLFWFSTNV